MPKSTKATKEQRVNLVYTLLLNGASRMQILQYASDPKQSWNVTTRQVDSYIAEANAMLAAEAEYHRGRELGKAIARLNNIYQHCMRVQDYGRAIAAQRELNALLALHEPEAAKTIRIEGVDRAQLQVLADALKAQGSDVNTLIAAAIRRLEGGYVH